MQMLGAGFDATVVANLDLSLKRRVGKAAYVAQPARELFHYPCPRFAVPLDGAREDAVAGAIVTKGRLYAGRHPMAPGAAPGERGFRVALFRGGGPVRAALYGAAPPLDLLPRLPGVEIRRASRVRLAAPGPPPILLPMRADGDSTGPLPVEVEGAPGPLRVVLPAGEAPISPSSPPSSSPRPSPP